MINKTGTRQCTRAIEVNFCNLCMVMQFLEAERTESSQKGPIQFSLGLPQPAYALAYMLTQVIYRERKHFHLTLAQRRICYNFLPFHDCLLRDLVILKLSSTLDIELVYNLLSKQRRCCKLAPFST